MNPYTCSIYCLSVYFPPPTVSKFLSNLTFINLKSSHCHHVTCLMFLNDQQFKAYKLSIFCVKSKSVMLIETIIVAFIQ